MFELLQTELKSNPGGIVWLVLTAAALVFGAWWWRHGATLVRGALNASENRKHKNRKRKNRP